MGAAAAQDFGFADWEEPTLPHRPAPRRAQHAPRAGRKASGQRARLIHRRRTDLRQDVALAVILAIVMLSITAGLAVIVLLSFPAIAVLIGSLVLERRRQRQRQRRSQ